MPDPITEDTLREWEAACEKATPGPWKSVGNSPAGGVTRRFLRTPWGLPIPFRYGSGCDLNYRPDELSRYSTAEYFWHEVDEDGEHAEPCCECEPWREVYERECADLAFIALARTALPAAIAEIRRLQEWQSRMERVIDFAAHVPMVGNFQTGPISCPGCMCAQAREWDEYKWTFTLSEYHHENCPIHMARQEPLPQKTARYAT